MYDEGKTRGKVRLNDATASEKNTSFVKSKGCMAFSLPLTHAFLASMVTTE